MMMIFTISTAVTGYIKAHNEFGDFVLLNGMYDLIASGASVSALIIIWIIRNKAISYKIPVLVLWLLLAVGGTFIQVYSVSAQENTITEVISQWATIYGIYTPFALQLLVLIGLFISFIIFYPAKNSKDTITI